MKKYLLLASVAALAFTSCSDQSTEFVGDSAAQRAREISFSPVARPTTRAAVDGTIFPGSGGNYGFKLACYDATTPQLYFNDGDFTWSSGDGSSALNPVIYHDATTPRYWPLSPAWFHFLAVTYNTIAADNTITTSFTTVGKTYAETGKAVVTLTDNSTKQNDLMYGIGNGEVQQNANNTLSFPDNVPIVFKHALASLRFTVQANVANVITVNSIVVNGAYNSGTYEITHTGYNNTSSTESVAGVWDTTTAATAQTTVPGSDFGLITTANTPSAEKELLIVPKASDTSSFTSFTVNYTIGGKDYVYTYTPTNVKPAQGNKFIYAITITLHEILVEASVTDWTGTAVPVAM